MYTGQRTVQPSATQLDGLCHMLTGKLTGVAFVKERRRKKERWGEEKKHHYEGIKSL